MVAKSTTSTLAVIQGSMMRPAPTRCGELGRLKQELIKLDDAAVVVRRADGQVKVKQATSLVGAGALGGAFWGMLIGLLFFMPGWEAGRGSGLGLAGKMQDIGVDDNHQAGGQRDPAWPVGAVRPRAGGHHGQGAEA
jgi:uncharacterized membrane protein